VRLRPKAGLQRSPEFPPLDSDTGSIAAVDLALAIADAGRGPALLPVLRTIAENETYDAWNRIRAATVALLLRKASESAGSANFLARPLDDGWSDLAVACALDAVYELDVTAAVWRSPDCAL